MPYADTEAMQKHLDEISKNVAPKAHAVILMDGAGWHKSGDLDMPKNISSMIIPPYSPELNPLENIWQFLRQSDLSNQVFEDYDNIVDACYDAWKRLTQETGRITSIASRKWVNIKGGWYYIRLVCLTVSCCQKGTFSLRGPSLRPLLATKLALSSSSEALIRIVAGGEETKWQMAIV
ncbi:MAG: transposase [Hyphomicrobiaceae bacterium]|nr:transposase [Hyphomicrobiaceae bacterium]